MIQDKCIIFIKTYLESCDKNRFIICEVSILLKSALNTLMHAWFVHKMFIMCREVRIVSVSRLNAGILKTYGRFTIAKLFSMRKGLPIAELFLCCSMSENSLWPLWPLTSLVLAVHMLLVLKWHLACHHINSSSSAAAEYLSNCQPVNPDAISSEDWHVG